MRIGLIWGAPRSGTSWLGHLVSRHPDVEYRFQPIHAYSFAPRIEANSSMLDLYRFYARLLVTRDPYLLKGLAREVKWDKKSVLSRLFPKALVLKETHDLNSIARIVDLDSNSRLTVLVRSPTEVIESWINAPREFKPEWNVEAEWRSASKKNAEYAGNHFGIDEWIKTTQRVVNLRERLPQQVRIIRYDQLRTGTHATIREVLAHFSLPFERYTFLPSSDTSINDHIDEYSVSRQRHRTCSWRLLSRESKAAIEQLVREAGLDDFLN